MAYAQQGWAKITICFTSPEAEVAFNRAYAWFVAGGVTSAADSLKQFMEETGL